MCSSQLEVCDRREGLLCRAAHVDRNQSLLSWYETSVIDKAGSA